MFKKRVILTSVLISIILIISGCSSEPIECEVDSDCAARTCFSATCDQNKCIQVPTPNCCGNKLKETTEDGKPGNSCTCPQDYGACQGTPKLTSGGRTYDAQFVQQFCENDACVVGVPPEKVRPVTLLDERNVGLFKMETIVTYNQPFTISKDKIDFKITLQDDTENLLLPVRLTKILLRDGEVIFGEQKINAFLENVGDTVEISVPVTYVPEQVEDTRGLSFQINYEASERVKDKVLSDGSIAYKEDINRDDFSKKFSSKVTFIKASQDE